MAEALRPLSLGEILDRTAQIYRRNFLLLAGVAVAPSVLIVGSGAAWQFLGRGAARGRAGIYLLADFASILIALTYSHAALTSAAIDLHLGRPLKARQAFFRILPRYGRFLWLTTLQALVVIGFSMVLLILALIPVIIVITIFTSSSPEQAGQIAAYCFLVAFLPCAGWFLARIALAVPACWAEDKTAWSSMKRGFILSKDARGKIAMAYVFFYAIALVFLGPRAAAVFGLSKAAAHGALHLAGTSLLVTEILEIFYSFAVQALLAPLASTGIAILYVDQRIRKEGFDIELLMQQAGLAAPLSAGHAGAELPSSMPLPDPATVKEP